MRVSSRKWECAPLSGLSMDWPCTLTEERLSDVLDRLLLPAESAAFSAHASECERCTRLVSQVGGIVSQVRRLAAVDEPPFLASRIIAVTRGTAEPTARGLFGWSPATSLSRLAMGLVTVAATFLIVFHEAGSGTSGKFPFNPASLFRDANRRAHLTYARGAKFVNGLRVVYEIQSRLSLQPQQPEPALEPTPAPAPEPREGRPDSEASPTRQPIPSTHRAFRSASVFALLVFAGQTRNAPEGTPRSLP